MVKHLPGITKFTPSGARISDNFQVNPKECSSELLENGKSVETTFKSKSSCPVAQLEKYIIPILWDTEELRLLGSS